MLIQIYTQSNYQKMITKPKTKAKRIGDLQLVENKARRFGSAKEYLFARLQYPTGLEMPMLFTVAELERAERRAEENREDLPSVGILRDLLD